MHGNKINILIKTPEELMFFYDWEKETATSLPRGYKRSVKYWTNWSEGILEGCFPVVNKITNKTILYYDFYKILKNYKNDEIVQNLKDCDFEFTPPPPESFTPTTIYVCSKRPFDCQFYGKNNICEDKKNLFSKCEWKIATVSTYQTIVDDMINKEVILKEQSTNSKNMFMGTHKELIGNIIGRAFSIGRLGITDFDEATNKLTEDYFKSYHGLNEEQAINGLNKTIEEQLESLKGKDKQIEELQKQVKIEQNKYHTTLTYMQETLKRIDDKLSK